MDAAEATAPDAASTAIENVLIDGQLAGASVLGGATLQRVATPFVTAVTVQRPRDIKMVGINAIHEAQEMKDDFYWEWEVREKDRRTGKRRPKLLRGISIDGALALLRIWGNCGYVPSLDAETPDKWTFLVSFVDYEAGTTTPRLYQKPKSVAPGTFDQERWNAMMFQDGQSKAIRNAIERSMPKWLVRRCIDAAKAAAVKALSSQENLQRERKEIVERAKVLGLTPAQLKAKAGKAVSQYKPEDVVTMKALLKSIEDGDATSEQMFGNGAEANAEPARKRDRKPAPKAKKEPAKAKEEPKKAAPPKERLFDKYARQLKDAKDEHELEWVGSDVADKLKEGELSQGEHDELLEIADMVQKKMSQAAKGK